MPPIAVDTSHSTAHTHNPVGQKSSVAPALRLDFAEWVGPKANEGSRVNFITQLRKACAGLGFFVLINTPLDEGDLKARIFALNKAFFDLPFEERQKITIVNSPHFRGFSKFGDERTRNAVDHRDQIDYGLEAAAVKGGESDNSDVFQKYPFLNMIGPNQFLPDHILPGHRSLVLQWLDLCQKLSHEITEALEQALGTKPGELQRIVTGNHEKYGNGKRVSDAKLDKLHAEFRTARMKTIRYPIKQHVDGIERLAGSTQGVGAHKDGGWITLLATSPHRGLQVQSLSGEWLDVVHPPDGIIVNFGQQMERVSRGAIVAATHRVVMDAARNAPQGDRFSIAFFSAPALNAIVEPISQSSFSSDMLHIWTQAQKERHAAHGHGDVTSDVPRGDLWGSDDAPFGFQAWKGITRSHREYGGFYSNMY